MDAAIKAWGAPTLPSSPFLEALPSASRNPKMWKCDKEPSTSKRSHTKAQPRREATVFSTGTASAEKASQLQSSCLAQLLDLIKDFRWWQGGKKKTKGEN